MQLYKVVLKQRQCDSLPDVANLWEHMYLIISVETQGGYFALGRAGAYGSSVFAQQEYFVCWGPFKSICVSSPTHPRLPAAVWAPELLRSARGCQFSGWDVE